MGQDPIDAAAALEAGMNVAAGLHQRLRDVPRLVALAEAPGLALFDVRDSPGDFVVGTGYQRAGPRLSTVGTDCSVGKMYATLTLTSTLPRAVSWPIPRDRVDRHSHRRRWHPGRCGGRGFISGAIERLAPRAPMTAGT